VIDKKKPPLWLVVLSCPLVALLFLIAMIWMTAVGIFCFPASAFAVGWAWLTTVLRFKAEGRD
jgi:hypothetical protein